MSRRLENERTIAVYLPPGYSKDRDRSYPVLYLQDGQNLFDAGTAAFGVDWNAHVTADRLVHEGAIPPIILVGIYNTPQRIAEYTPFFDPRRQGGGDADKYIGFIADEIKPFVDHQYRTLPGREYTAIAGSSLGGLISLCTVHRRHDVFSICAALSPSLWWMESQLFELWSSDSTWLTSCRFWIDMGTHETHSEAENLAGVERCQRLVALMKNAGLTEPDQFRFETIDGGGHCEAAWAARFGEVLTFLFGSIAP